MSNLKSSTNFDESNSTYDNLTLKSVLAKDDACIK